MTINQNYFYALIIIILLSASAYLISSEFIDSYSGPDTISDPIQKDMVKKTISHPSKDGNIDITFLAKYNISAVVKSKKKYVSDGSSTVSPIDFALVWGTLNQEDIDEHIKYSQRHRWYYYRTDGKESVTFDYISEHSANTHIIPANESVASIIKGVRKNDYITLEGYLASVHFPNGDWSSSLSRKDTGNGACEIMYVEHIIIH